MGQLLRFPADAGIFDRLTEQQRLANLAMEYAEAVETARRIIDDPRGYTDAQLREVCAAYMASGAGGPHYLRADAHIYAINRREQIARNRAKQTPAQIARGHRDRWPAILAYGAVGAVILLSLTGWL